MSDFILTPEKVNEATKIIDDNLVNFGVLKVLVIDDAGNILTEAGNESLDIDSVSLAALTAANFGATSQIAKLIGEEDFSLLFHKGESQSIHFTRVGKELIMISIFSENVSLGLIRCRVADITGLLQNIFEG